MTENEIIKALKHCKTTSCTGCPYAGDDLLRECIENLIGDALVLINRQKAKIEALQMDNDQLQSDVINANCNCDHIIMLLEDKKDVSYNTKFRVAKPKRLKSILSYKI